MAIEGLKKHVGLLNNTGVRVAVVFRKIPGDEKNCLIVETERLPDSYHDYLIQCLNSREAMETNEFYEVLHRRNFPDGLNCLSALHQRAYLRKEPISNVKMVPLPNQSVPLELINATIDKKVEEYMAQQKAAEVANSVTSTTPTNVEDPVAVAKGLIVQAELLEQDASSKRDQAYALAPELRPRVGRPALDEEAKKSVEEDRKAKRRERERARAAEKRAQKVVSALDAKVAAKLERDSKR